MSLTETLVRPSGSEKLQASPYGTPAERAVRKDAAINQIWGIKRHLKSDEAFRKKVESLVAGIGYFDIDIHDQERNTAAAIMVARSPSPEVLAGISEKAISRDVVQVFLASYAFSGPDTSYERLDRNRRLFTASRHILKPPFDYIVAGSLKQQINEASGLTDEQKAKLWSGAMPPYAELNDRRKLEKLTRLSVFEELYSGTELSVAQICDRIGITKVVGHDYVNTLGLPNRRDVNVRRAREMVRAGASHAETAALLGLKKESVRWYTAGIVTELRKHERREQVEGVAALVRAGVDFDDTLRQLGLDAVGRNIRYAIMVGVQQSGVELPTRHNIRKRRERIVRAQYPDTSLSRQDMAAILQVSLPAVDTILADITKRSLDCDLAEADDLIHAFSDNPRRDNTALNERVDTIYHQLNASVSWLTALAARRKTRMDPAHMEVLEEQKERLYGLERIKGVYYEHLAERKGIQPPEKYRGDVTSLAYQYRNSGEPLDDLIQAGMMGLMRAMDRFEPDRGIAFMSFAQAAVIGEIKNHFRNETWSSKVPRWQKDMRRPLLMAAEELAQRHGRQPTVSEIAEHLGIEVQRVAQASSAVNSRTSVSIFSSGHNDDDSGEMSLPDARSEREFATAELKLQIAKMLADLPALDRKVLVMSFYYGLSQAEIASHIGKSQRQVSSMLSQTLLALRVKLSKSA